VTGTLGYDPLRLATLARMTQAAADEVGVVASDEPFAADAVATARGIAGDFGDALRSSLHAALSSTAMTEWVGGTPFWLTVDELIGQLEAQAGVLTPSPDAPPFSLDGDELSLAESVTTVDPAQWFSMINPACVAFAGGSYHGGGYVTDHRGERYPIVVPRVETDDGDVYTADDRPVEPGEPSVATLGGSDPGWEVVGTATGVARFQQRPSLVESFLGGVAGTTGLLRPLPPNAGLVHIAAPVVGPPHLADEPPPVPGPLTLPPGGGVPDPAASSPASLVEAGTGLALTLGQGSALVAAMDNQTQRAYRVVFERNGDGRRRARICTYSLAHDGEGGVVIVPEHVYVDGEGRLTSETISYGTPYEGGDSYLSAARDDVAPFVFSGDEPISSRVHAPAFPDTAPAPAEE
jgi:hypothetical protein